MEFCAQHFQSLTLTKNQDISLRKNSRNSAQTPSKIKFPVPSFRIPFLPCTAAISQFVFPPDVPFFLLSACVFNRYISLHCYFLAPDSTQPNLPQDSPWDSSVTTPIFAQTQKKTNPILTQGKKK